VGAGPQPRPRAWRAPSFLPQSPRFFIMFLNKLTCLFCSFPMLLRSARWLDQCTLSRALVRVCARVACVCTGLCSRLFCQVFRLELDLSYLDARDVPKVTQVRQAPPGCDLARFELEDTRTCGLEWAVQAS
jgi:hypothetical protein